MMKKYIQFLFLCVLVSGLQAQTQPGEIPYGTHPGQFSRLRFLGTTPQLRDVAPAQGALPTEPAAERKKPKVMQDLKVHNPEVYVDALPRGLDPLLANDANRGGGGGAPIVVNLNIEGMHEFDGVAPPDPTGDVGPNHYVQGVNSGNGMYWQIFDKQGNSLLGPVSAATLWQPLGITGIGDGIVIYDQGAQRWVICEITWNDLILFAVSLTDDPLGAWNAYQFVTVGFPDYPKLYVWPDAYYVTANEIANGNECTGYAIERAAVLAGAPAPGLQRFSMPVYPGIAYQPPTGVDWEGDTPPPPSAPGMIMRVYDDAWGGGQDHLEMWEVNVDWVNPNNSQLVGPTNFYPTPFNTTVCQGWLSCIEQPDPNAPLITALDQIIMYRCPYRNFGNYESILLNHTDDVTGGDDAGIRWYELRRTPGNPWSIYQEGTYSIDNNSRFMATIAQDDRGNIALAYSVSSSIVHPTLRITGRRSGDPLGTMTVPEYELAPATGISFSNRWGDYSALMVDPLDQRQFWFTGEYMKDSQHGWYTRIASFQLRQDSVDVGPDALVTPVPSPNLGTQEQVQVSIRNFGLVAQSNFTISMSFEGGPPVTEFIGATIQPGGTLVHTFTPTVDMNVVGQVYHFQFVTSLVGDTYAQNDTFDIDVRKLTSNDGAVVDFADLTPIVCNTSEDMGIVIRNASAVNMTSLQVHYQLNGGTVNNINWTGNLAPGARDTVLVTLAPLIDGTNNVMAWSTLPNGNPDQDVLNDSHTGSFTANTNGSSTVMYFNTDFWPNESSWALFDDQGVQLYAHGAYPTGQTQYVENFCLAANGCYELVIYDSYGDGLQAPVDVIDAYGDTLVHMSETDFYGYQINFTFCVTVRDTIDIGPTAMLSPNANTGVGTPEHVAVRIRNHGLTPVSSFAVSYSIDGGVPVTENVNYTIAPGTTYDYTFNATETFAPIGANYDFLFRTILAGDTQPENDTLTANFLHQATLNLQAISIDTTTLHWCGVTSGNINLSYRNVGTQMINSLDVNTVVNGQLVNVAPQVVNLAPGASANVTVPVNNLQHGNNTVSMYTSHPNGFNDQQPVNDTASAIVDVDTSSALLQISIVPDNFPAQVRWRLYDDNGVILAQGGPFQTPWVVNQIYVCVPSRACYVFELLDAGNNGMQGVVFVQSPYGVVFTLNNHNFGASISSPFCLNPPCGTLTATAVTLPETPGQNNGQITVTPVNGQAPYTYSLDNVNYQPSPVFNNLAAGNYTVYVMDASGCSYLIFPVEVDVATPVLTLEEAMGVRMYPNPTRDLLTIEVANPKGLDRGYAEIFDVTGKAVTKVFLAPWNNTLRGMTSLEGLASGVYAVRVRAGNDIVTMRITKE